MRCLFIACLMVFMAAPVMAQSVIRDTEIEESLRDWGAPVFRAAGLQPDNVNIILINDSDVNAFVAGGPNIFLYTGLIKRSENPEELIGVMAHETGHISGGHLIRLRQSVEQASYETIIGTVLGIGAAMISGESGAAGAIISGSQSMATRRFLANTRLNESSADQAGLGFMSKAGIDPQGLVSFLGKLEGEELLPTSQQSEYIRTHPLTRNRMEALETGVQNSPAHGKPAPKSWDEAYRRMKAKLIGYVQPDQVAWLYPNSDTSVAGRYARAIAAYRQNHVDEALRLADALIASEPNNPYFLELKGQMLVEFGRVRESLPSYKKAVAKAPQAALIKIAYAHALIESAGTDGKALWQAIDLLDDAEKDEKRSTRIHRLLATAYGRLGDETNARLHLAEEAVLQGRNDEAKRFATYVKDNAPKGSRTALRARDILTFLDQGE